MDYLFSSIRVAGSGLQAQSERLRVISENIANANSTASVSGGDPYSRKTITFAEQLERETGSLLVRVADVSRDLTPFRTQYDPGNPAADADGYVKKPNVNMLIEMADMREATRAYEANVQVIRQARDLLSLTFDLMRNA